MCCMKVPMLVSEVEGLLIEIDIKLLGLPRNEKDLSESHELPERAAVAPGQRGGPKNQDRMGRGDGTGVGHSTYEFM